jgi:hypothetical protein
MRRHRERTTRKRAHEASATVGSLGIAEVEGPSDRAGRRVSVYARLDSSSLQRAGPAILPGPAPLPLFLVVHS